MRKRLIGVISILLLMITQVGFAQDFWKNHQINLNEKGTNYIKLTGLVQTWVRNMEYNPGSTVFGYAKNSGTDIGIRRYRVQLYAQVTDNVFFYSQFGENNFNSISDRKTGFFVHDAYGEYAVDKTKFSIGAGLSGWSGLTRFSSPAVGSILGIDAPIFLQSTNDVTDQFLRKLSVYAKGKLGKLDYRLALAQPMAIQKSANFNAATALTTTTAFSAEPPKIQWNGYVQYQFLDQEGNLTPYNTGTYLGKKRVFNVGAGFVFQKDALWHLSDAADPNSIVRENMAHYAVDVFYDAPVGKKGAAISCYGTFVNYDFGNKYYRNAAIMNPANGTTNTNLLNGSGNGFPMYGSGTVLYAQIGYKFKDNLMGKTTLMPYASVQHANYDRLYDTMNYYDVGVNWLLAGHNSKLTVSYQNRPLYTANGDLTDHMGALVAQYQVFLN
ncbi:hypothetical protein [Flavobacterium sp. N1719]|uniref:hypothetical protein n=1 Tax=Flavobacterium sp. N1719 TaxID=2885633 RepID=UPI00222304A5|nr:hypothetical protein [Flavobacterium sp. N1719]